MNDYALLKVSTPTTADPPGEQRIIELKVDVIERGKDDYGDFKIYYFLSVRREWDYYVDALVFDGQNSWYRPVLDCVFIKAGEKFKADIKVYDPKHVSHFVTDRSELEHAG